MRLTTKSNPAFNQQSKLRWTKRLYVQRYVRLVKRLIRMSWPEIVHRLGVAVRKRYNSSTHLLNQNTHHVDSTSLTFLQSLGPSIKERLSSHFEERFFFAPSQRKSIAKAVAERVPASVERTVFRANSISQSKLEVLGQKLQVNAGKIDWRADPQTCQHAWPNGPLTEDDAINVSSADVKYVWEINRHQFLTYLGRAFWLTEKPEYARQACDLIDDWIDHNPVGQGVNWCSHLEVAMRSISWLWTMPYLLAWGDLDDIFLKRWLQSIFHHHHHLSHNLSLFTDPTNHLIGEATALWMLSVCLPDLPDAQDQAERAQKILVQELDNQVTADGVNKEHASSYHRFVLDFYLQVLIVSRRLGKPLPAACERRIEAMMHYAAALAGRYGFAPMTGDSDDARGIPFPELVGWDFRDLLSTGAVLFERPEWKKQAGDLIEATIWLAGKNAIKTFDNLPNHFNPNVPRIFTSGGYCFFSSSRSDHEVELIFDAGPLGLWPNAAHGHSDALGILIRIDGNFLLTDSGTGAYFDPHQTRDAYRRTAAHNTVSVDELDQADIFDTFKWVNPINVQLLHSYIGDDFFFAAGAHDGYQRLREPLMHYRSLLSVGLDGEWIIIDHLEGKGKHSITRHFNFPPGVCLNREDLQRVTGIDKTSGLGLQFTFPATDRATQNVTYLDDGGIWSDHYGHEEPAPHLAIETSGVPPMTLFTFISPILDSSSSEYLPVAPDISVSTLENGDTVVCRRTNAAPGNSSMDTIVANRKAHEFTLPGGIRSNAEFLFVRHLYDGSIQNALLVGENRYLCAPDFLLECKNNGHSVSYTS